VEKCDERRLQERVRQGELKETELAVAPAHLSEEQVDAVDDAAARVLTAVSEKDARALKQAEIDFARASRGHAPKPRFVSDQERMMRNEQAREQQDDVDDPSPNATPPSAEASLSADVDALPTPSSQVELSMDQVNCCPLQYVLCSKKLLNNDPHSEIVRQWPTLKKMAQTMRKNNPVCSKHWRMCR
jgi:hypothetical protein